MPQQTHDLTYAGDTVVKCYRQWDRDEPEREWTSLTLAAEAHPGLAPTPLERTTVGGRPAIVMSRVPGTTLGDRRLTAEQTTAVGDALRRLHEIGAEMLPVRMAERLTGPSTLRASVADWISAGADLTECRDPALVRDAIAVAREWLAESPLPPSDDRGVLGRADGNLANCIWDGSRVRLVDFEDAGGSEAAFELADHVEHISFRRSEGEPELAAAAGGLTDDDRPRWWHYRKDFAAFWLAMLLPGNRGFGRNPRGTTEWQARHLLGLLGTATRGSPPGG